MAIWSTRMTRAISRAPHHLTKAPTKLKLLPPTVRATRPALRYLLFEGSDIFHAIPVIELQRPRSGCHSWHWRERSYRSVSAGRIACRGRFTWFRYTRTPRRRPGDPGLKCDQLCVAHGSLRKGDRQLR